MQNQLSSNVQESFLEHARKERLNVTVYLMNGTKLTGRIKDFDRFSIILQNNGIDQMLFKHAISTIGSPRGFGNFMKLDSTVGSLENEATQEKKNS